MWPGWNGGDGRRDRITPPRSPPCGHDRLTIAIGIIFGRRYCSVGVMQKQFSQMDSPREYARIFAHLLPFYIWIRSQLRELLSWFIHRGLPPVQFAKEYLQTTTSSTPACLLNKRSIDSRVFVPRANYSLVLFFSTFGVSATFNRLYPPHLLFNLFLLFSCKLESGALNEFSYQS